jgi:hypothetical protein
MPSAWTTGGTADPTQYRPDWAKRVDKDAIDPSSTIERNIMKIHL